MKRHSLAPRPGLAALGAAALLLALPGLAHAVAPRLASVSPAGAQRGSEVEVRLAGSRLDDTRELVLYSPGISLVKMDEPRTNLVKVTLRIAPDCQLGEHSLRLRTATGVSELRTFWVGALPVVSETETNSEPARAQKVSLNSTVTGSIPADDQDFFQVTLAQGQRLSAEVEAMRLGRAVFDPALSIHDASGRLLASADDSILALQDPFLSFVAPAAGDYLVQVRESSYGGGDGYTYRLHLGTFPRPSAVYPAGGPAGATLDVTFLGDAAGDLPQKVRLPAEAQERFGLFATQNGALAPSPNWVRVSPFPNVLESGPNQSRDQATATDLKPPLALNGIVTARGQADWFRFKAAKGQALEVNVFARRLRSPLDSIVEVFDAKGASVGSNDDSGGPDSSVRFTPAADGDYFVKIRDHLQNGGPDFVYRIEITPPSPSLALRTPEVARNDTQSRQYIAVPRGNRFATLVSVRRSGAPGDLTFKADGLPAGVKLLADPMPAKLETFPLVFEAGADAPIAGKLLNLTAATPSGVTGHWHNQVELVQGPNNTSYYGTRVDQLVVAVTEAAPFSIRLATPKVPLVQGGSMDLAVIADRAPGFNEPINLKLVWAPPGVTSLPDVTIPRGTNRAAFILNAKADADLGTWKLAMHGAATNQGGLLHVSSPLTPLAIAAPFLSAKIETSFCQPGQSTNIVVKLEQLTPFQGKATLKLLGLPEKAEAPERQITSKDTEVIFPLKVDPTCPPGSHRNLFVSAAVPQNGAVIPHSLGAGGILRIVPVKKPAVAESGTKKVAQK